MKNRILIIALAGLLFASCGVSNKTTSVKVPTQAEADSIMNLNNAAVFVVEKAAGPVIYGFTAHPDSALVSVHSQTFVKKGWVKSPVVTYPCGEEFRLPLSGGPESISTREIAGAKYLSFSTTREKEGQLQKSVILYHPDSEMMYNVSFEGKKRRDGKIYGQTDLSMQSENTLPQKVWADSILRATPGFVILSKEQLMSDQAIEWWNEKNPAALTKASKINFGSLPAECTLVQQYSKTKKESGQAFRAALFDTAEHTIIVAQNRSTGEYSLVWVEPKCKNTRTDRFLNSIYFASGSRLVLFYYKGSKTFKYTLSLASGQLQR